MAKKWTHWLVRVQLLWLLLAVAAPLAFRASLIPWRPAVVGVAVAACGMVLIGFFSLLVLFFLLRTNRQGQSRHCLVAVALSLFPLAGAFFLGLQGAKVPPIHDISTDTANPPFFSMARNLRQPGDNSIAYPGAAAADQQRQAYPDIAPLEVPIAPEDAFHKSRTAAVWLQWQIVGQDQEQGIIEAVDRTPVFGFADDIVIRITAAGGGSRVDIRSASRAGVSDLGVNAKRIRTFMRTFKEIQPE